MASLGPAAASNLHNSSHISQVRACGTCSRAKAKCVPDQEGNGKCQRCQRLSKICEPAAPPAQPQPRKRKPKTTAPKSRVGKLEEKLDGLVSLIKSTQDLTSSQVTVQLMGDATPKGMMTQPVDFSAHSPTISRSQNQVDRGMFISQNGRALSQFVPIRQASSPATSHRINNYASSDPILSNSFMPSFAEGDAFLETFRDQLTPQFPFLTLPQPVSAVHLYEERPFFYLCILAVTSRDSVQQQGLGKLVMKQLAERVFERSERNLDLLLGALTYATWCYYNCWNVPQITSLISAASTLVLDLGLSRPLPPKTALNRSLFYEALRDSCGLGLLAWTKTTRTLEEQRAFLGYYFLSSVISLYLRRIDPPLKFTPYLEDCVKVLGDSGDHPNDTLAVALVRLQGILERVHQTSWHKKPGPCEINSGTVFIITSIEQELRQFRKTLLPEQANNATVLLHCHVIEMSLFEAGLCTPPVAADPIPSFKRLELLCACLEANKSYFEAFFCIPPASYVTVSLHTWSQLSYGLAILHTLFSFEHPDWDLASVRQSIDYNVIFGRLIGNLDKLITLEGFEKLDVFSRSAKWMKCIGEYVETKMAALPLAAVGHEANQMPDFGTGADDLTDFFQFLDDAWMTDMMVPPESHISTMTGD